MPRPNRFLLAQTEILAFFSAGPKTIFSEDELAGVLFTNKHGWRLPDSAGLSKFIAFLGSHGQLQTHVFRSEPMAATSPVIAGARPPLTP